MTARIATTRLDAGRQTLVCQVCGDEIPAPIGDVAWVLAVTRAFADVHRGRRHRGGRTAFTRVIETMDNITQTEIDELLAEGGRVGVSDTKTRSTFPALDDRAAEAGHMEALDDLRTASTRGPRNELEAMAEERLEITPTEPDDEEPF